MLLQVKKVIFSGMPIPNAAAMVVSYLMICNVLDEKFSLHIFDIKFLLQYLLYQRV